MYEGVSEVWRAAIRRFANVEQPRYLGLIRGVCLWTGQIPATNKIILCLLLYLLLYHYGQVYLPRLQARSGVLYYVGTEKDRDSNNERISSSGMYSKKMSNYKGKKIIIIRY